MLGQTRAIGLLAVCALAGCATPKPMSVTQLLANPSTSDNRTVRVRGCLLYQADAISALADECSVALSYDYRPYARTSIDLVPPDQGAAWAGRYIDVTGTFRRYGRNHGEIVLNLRGISDLGQIEVSRIKESLRP